MAALFQLISSVTVQALSMQHDVAAQISVPIMQSVQPLDVPFPIPGVTYTGISRPAAAL